MNKLADKKKEDPDRASSPLSKEEEKAEENGFWENLMKKVDSNQDGKISFQEFHVMISRCI